MREPRVVRLGKVSVREGDIVIEAERDVEVRARPGEELLLALFYDYREGGVEREHVHLAIRAALGTRPEVLGETRLVDRPGVVDDRRGYFSVPVRAPPEGTLEGRAEVRGAYSTQAWVGGGERTELPVRASIPVRVRVAPLE